MQPVYYAHSLKDKETHDWQLLSRHLREVANLAGDLGAPLGIGRVTTLAGLLHDLGKYNPAFQAYIAGHGSSVDHSTAGARLVGDMTDPKTVDKIAAELVAYAVAGHHVGLPDKQSSGPSSLDERLRGFVDTLDPVWRTEIAPETSDLLPKLAWVKGDTDKAAFQLALLGRMIFSCLVDADFRNTEQFYAEAEGRDVDRQWPALINVLPRLLARFDAHMDGMPASDESINRLRRHILIHVRGKANLTPGLFTLTVPTGGGKTLASLGFALDHARRYGHSRIIYAIPFAGAWIETMLRRARGPSRTSPLSRGRGSKQRSRPLVLSAVSSLLSRWRGSKLAVVTVGLRLSNCFGYFLPRVRTGAD